MTNLLAWILASAIYWALCILVFLLLAYFNIWLFVKVLSWADKLSERERVKHKNDKINY